MKQVVDGLPAGKFAAQLNRDPIVVGLHLNRPLPLDATLPACVASQYNNRTTIRNV